MNPPTRIMVVEDEALVAQDIGETLEDLGYEVAGIVSSGKEAVKMAEETLPDLTIMDIRLQGEMDGIEAAKIIYERSGIPIIFLTAHSEPDTLDRAKFPGTYAYITKPFDEKDLQNAISLALHRKMLDLELTAYHKTLEAKVRQQTKALEQANTSLQNQVAKLELIRASLEEKTAQLQDANGALRYILEQRDQDNAELGKRINQNVNDLVLPYLESLGKTRLSPAQQDYVDLITSNVKEILKPFAQHLTSKQIGLTHMEIKVADLVKNGKRNKEISVILSIAPKTVEFYRENIRKKLGIRNQKINLRSFLNTL